MNHAQDDIEQRVQLAGSNMFELLLFKVGHARDSGERERYGINVFKVREIVEMLYEFEKPFILDSTKFEKTFGMKATPIEQAVRETVAYFRAHPKSESKAA